MFKKNKLALACNNYPLKELLANFKVKVENISKERTFFWHIQTVKHYAYQKDRMKKYPLMDVNHVCVRKGVT